MAVKINDITVIDDNGNLSAPSVKTDELVVNGNNYPSAGALSSRNRIINGNFSVNQREVSGTVVLSAGDYGFDMWKAGASGCTFTFATSANVITITISAGSLVQVLKGFNLQSGTHVLSWTGTVQFEIDGDTAGDTGMTATLTGGTDATIETSGTGTLALVQLERGSVVTPFEHRLSELQHCQVYYEVLRYFGRWANSAYCYSTRNWATPKWTEPTITHGSVGGTNSSLAGSGIVPRGTHSFDVLHLNSSSGGDLTVTIYGDCSP